MEVKNPNFKIATSEKDFDISSNLEELSFYDKGDITFSAGIDGGQISFTITNMNMTNIKLLLAEWVKIYKDSSKVIQFFVILNNKAMYKNIINTIKIIATDGLQMLSFKTYGEFAKMLLSDEDIDNDFLLSQGIVKINRSKFENFVSSKVEKNTAKGFSDSKIIETYPENIDKFIDIDTGALAKYIADAYISLKSKQYFYIINKLEF